MNLAARPARVGVEAIKGHRTTAQIAQMFGVHPTQVGGQQCEPLGLARSSYYYQPRPESAENLRLLRRLDELYLECPFFGSRRMAITLEVNRKRMQRLMRIAGIEALYPKPNLSRPAPGHESYPYLLRGVSIEKPNTASRAGE